MNYLNFFQKKNIVLVILFVLTFLIYGQSLSGEYVYDDRSIVEYSNILSDKQMLGEVAMHPYWEAYAGLYRPTTLISYSFNFLIFGNDPFSFHLINLLLYVFICFFIYLLIKRLFNDALLAFISSLLFLILPIHTEVVANITGRSELLALFFALLIMLEFTKNKINYYLLGLWTLLAIGGKETGIAVVPILAIIFYQKNGISIDAIKLYFKEISGVAIAVLLYFFLRFYALGADSFLSIKTSLIENQLLFTDALSRIGTGLKILWMYFYKTFWPTDLCSDYSYNQIETVHNWLNPGTIWGLLVLSTSVFLLFYFIKRDKILALGAGIFLFSFLPVSNILLPIGTIAGERLFFFPSLGIVLITAYLINKLYKSKNKTIIITTIILMTSILLSYVIISHKRQQVWLNEENLFKSAGMCAPNSVLSLSNLGAVYLINGDLEKAEIELKKSMDIKPIYSKGINNLGLTYFKQGSYDKAKELYYKALQQEFPYSGTMENLVLLFLETGELDKAKWWIKFLYNTDNETTTSIIQNYLKLNR